MQVTELALIFKHKNPEGQTMEVHIAPDGALSFSVFSVDETIEYSYDLGTAASEDLFHSIEQGMPQGVTAVQQGLMSNADLDADTIASFIVIMGSSTRKLDPELLKLEYTVVDVSRNEGRSLLRFITNRGLVEYCQEAHSLKLVPGANPCVHANAEKGPNIPLRHGSWSSEICLDCKAWRPMGHTPRLPVGNGEWRHDDINEHTKEVEDA